MLLIRRLRLERAFPDGVQPSHPTRPAKISTREIVMANLVPRDTFFHDMFDFRRNFDQAFNRLLRWPSASQEERSYEDEFAPAVEAYIDRENKKFHCEVMLPGLDPKDVDIQVHGNTLTITGERTNTRETRDADFLLREITYGSFTRSIVLPEGADKEKITAEYRNGVLEITAPIAAASLPKKVEIKSLPSSRAASA
jgi:HSP20 family protein